jgi:hypothetical protein
MDGETRELCFTVGFFGDALRAREGGMLGEEGEAVREREREVEGEDEFLVVSVCFPGDLKRFGGTNFAALSLVEKVWRDQKKKKNKNNK